jgi:uncharacterized protein (TIGR03083 family)
VRVAHTLDFPGLLRLIDDRSAAFRAAVASAPDLGAPVPSCPQWTLLDLVQHLGQGQRKWAAVVAAGPADAPPAEFGPGGLEPAPAGREALLAWWAASTRVLLAALRESGPDRGCWTWWDRSISPQTSGAVARHRVQEVAVHTYDAQLTLGDPQPLPDEVALDGVDEFLTTCVAGAYAWPYKPCVLDYHVTGGGTWRLSFAADGIRIIEPGRAVAADASTTASAAELVLWFYGRRTPDDVKIDGDRRLFELLIDWDPDA